MRDIKYRAWLKNYKMMVVPKDLKNPINNQYIVYMVYTGYKDKNNKEIYEGDIIKAVRIFYKRETEHDDQEGEVYTGRYTDEVTGKFVLLGVVAFRPSSGFYTKDNIFKTTENETSNSYFRRIHPQAEELTVVGNIYEHPNWQSENETSL